MITRRTLLPIAATLIAGVVSAQSWAEPEPEPEPENGSPNLPGLGEMTRANPPRPVPDVSFQTADGQTVALSSFRGRGVVLNFWATWCVPCVLELPALADLSRTLAPDDIGVLPLSTDRGGVPVVTRFLADRGVTGLPILLDPMSAASHAFATRGIPTTILIGKDGMERARMEGAADWASAASVAMVRSLLIA